jgi:phage-related protein
MTEKSPLKPVIWVGSSRKDFGEFPDPVKDRMGYALYVAQQGGKHADAKPLKGYGGAAVVEIVRDHRGDTFRTIYAVRLAGVVYVLHAFQKKSKKGGETSKADIDLIDRRLREAERIAKERRQ